jgi:hypothetical protein
VIKHETNMSDKISVGVILTVIAALFNPLAGAIAATAFIIMWARRQRRKARAVEHYKLVHHRGDPAAQATMRGNGDNGGLSIEEQNAYRRAAHQQRR